MLVPVILFYIGFEHIPQYVDLYRKGQRRRAGSTCTGYEAHKPQKEWHPSKTLIAVDLTGQH